MALRSPKDAPVARRIGISWMVLSMVGAMSVGLIGLAYFTRNPEATLTDTTSAESVFLDLAQILLHPLVAGFVLAAVLAAIMSTLSSQLVVCSSALAEDLYKVVSHRTLSNKVSLRLGQAGVLAVSLVAALLAMNPESSVLELVSFAWAGFGAAFGPIVLLSLYWRKLTAWGAIAGLIAASVTVFVWGNTEALHSAMYEIVPGFIINLVIAVVVSLITYKANSVEAAEINEEFDRAVALTR